MKKGVKHCKSEPIAGVKSQHPMTSEMAKLLCVASQTGWQSSSSDEDW
jgi:hypothetical protein